MLVLLQAEETQVEQQAGAVVSLRGLFRCWEPAAVVLPAWLPEVNPCTPSVQFLLKRDAPECIHSS